MIKTTIRTEDFKELLLPFKYNDVLIYAKELGNTSGLYGYKDDGLFFMPLAEIKGSFEIDSPESVDELHEFMTSLDYIIQRISMNNNVVLDGHMQAMDMKTILEPFVRFSRSFEKNMHILEGLKNGY